MVLQIVQRSPYIHMGKLLFVSSTLSLLQFVVADLVRVLVVDKGGFNSLHGRAWLQPLYDVIDLWLI